MTLFINFIGILIELFIPIVLFKKLGNQKLKPFVFIILLILVFFMQLLNNTFFLTKSFVVMLISLLSIFLISLFFNLSLKARLFSSLFIFVVGALSETFIGVFFTFITKISMTELQTNQILFFICTLSSKFLQLTIVHSICFRKRNHKIKNNVHISFDLFPLPFASLIILLLLFECCYKITDFSFQIIVIISSLLLILANIFIFNLLEKQSDYINTKTQLAFTKKLVENQLQHYEELYKFQHEIKTFRHDVKNWSTSLLALLESNNTYEAIVSIKEKLDLISDSTHTPLFSNNPVIDAIIQAKIKTAATLGIKIEPTILINTEILVDQIELGVLIGNGLDNAIEATSQIRTNLSPTIHIKIISIVEQLSIEISNPVLNNIDTNNIVSTKSDSENHGFGLQSIKTIAKKYNGDLFLSCENYIFKINIILANNTTVLQKTST